MNNHILSNINARLPLVQTARQSLVQTARLPFVQVAAKSLNEEQ
jgi:hypothetical protein